MTMPSDEVHCSEVTTRRPFHCTTRPEYRIAVADGEWLTCHRHLVPFLIAAFQAQKSATVTPVDPDDWRWNP